MESKTRVGYCFKCHSTVNAINSRCPQCKRLMWELLAQKCGELPLRTTSAHYAALVAHARKSMER